MEKKDKKPIESNIFIKNDRFRSEKMTRYDFKSNLILNYILILSLNISNLDYNKSADRFIYR